MNKGEESKPTELLEPTKIGMKLSVGASCEVGEDGKSEIGIYIASEDVSASIAFHKEEWDLFLAAINRIDTLIP